MYIIDKKYNVLTLWMIINCNFYLQNNLRVVVATIVIVVLVMEKRVVVEDA